ncbi:MAG: hypothetical protein ABSF29_00590 [Tepidisphaeraceae bacterium]|jgi:hypothetical protein
MRAGLQFSLLLVALIGLGDAPATQPADKPPLDSKSMGIADECTVLFSEKLRDYLHPDAGQLTLLSDLRNRLDFQIEGIVYVEPVQHTLSDFGRKVRDVLTMDQDKQLQALFDQGVLKPMEVRAFPRDQKPPASSRGNERYRWIEVLYTNYGVIEVEASAAAMPDGQVGGSSIALLERIANRPGTPDGCDETEIVGGSGGSPFTTARTAGDQVIGFRYSVANWMGQPILHTLEPIYASTDESFPVGKEIEMANDGYIVGGMTVDSDRCVNAIQIIYVRLKDGKIDPKDTYTSPWCGMPTGNFQQTLGNNGEAVVGICGRRGLNLDALGLVQAPINP